MNKFEFQYACVQFCPLPMKSFKHKHIFKHDIQPQHLNFKNSFK